MSESNETTSTVPPPVNPHVTDYVLTEDERANFHSDEVRAEIRQRVSRELSKAETVYIKDADGQVWDCVSGDLDIEETLSQLSPEEREAKRLEVEAFDAETERMATVIRPAAMQRLRADARAEFRDYVRSQTNEILKLRADLGRANLRENNELNRLKAELAGTRAANIQLTKKVEALQAQLNRQPAGATSAPPTAGPR
jgi:hypothetical protein